LTTTKLALDLSGQETEDAAEAAWSPDMPDSEILALLRQLDGKIDRIENPATRENT
jgi:hypothetical protein